MQLDSTPEASAEALARYRADLKHLPPFSREQEQVLVHRLAQGDPQARAQLIETTLRLVPVIAEGYQGRGVPLLDLIQEGNLGLLLAAERFDPTQSTRFGAYAAWWIRKRILAALARQRFLIPLPQYRLQLWGTLRQTALSLQQEAHDALPLTLAAQRLGFSEEQVRETQRLLALSRVLSLEQPSTDTEDTVADLLRAPDPEGDAASEATLRARLRRAVTMLPPLQQTILALAYQDNDPPLTNVAIGKRLGYTGARIGQLRTQALAHLRTLLRAASWPEEEADDH